jgi:hypothetical protein
MYVIIFGKCVLDRLRYCGIRVEYKDEEELRVLCYDALYTLEDIREG